MQYLCPKCGNFMRTICTASIPANTRYECYSCGYVSKWVSEQPLYMTLPVELRPEEEDEI